MPQSRCDFAAVTVFGRIAVLGGTCTKIDLHDADAILQYDPEVGHSLLLFRTFFVSLFSFLQLISRSPTASHVGISDPERCQGRGFRRKGRCPADEQDAPALELWTVAHEYSWG